MEADGTTFLVESKATLQTEQAIRETIDEEIPGMARLFLSARLLDRRPAMGLPVSSFFPNIPSFFIPCPENIM